MAKIEFYVNGADKHIAVLDDGSVPRKGEYVTIRRQTYRVDRVTWAVDSEPDQFYGKLRANVELSPVGVPQEPTP
jgi:hypothetical protein